MIPIYEVPKYGDPFISYYVEEDPMPKFVFDEEDIAVQAERRNYYATTTERRSQVFEFIRELKQDHAEELLEIFKEQRDECMSRYDNIVNHYVDSLRNGIPNWLASAIKDIQDPVKLSRKIKVLISEIDFLEGRKYNQDGITDEDIVKAKNYPFENLIEIKRGKAICPFHKEKTPSFSIHKKENFGYCFGCGKGVDTIAFVMETRNVNFVEAVKLLS